MKKPRSRAKAKDSTAGAGRPPGRSRVLLITLATAIAVVVLSALLFRSQRDMGHDFPNAGSAAGHNVLIITLDTTRADRLGCYGYAGAETPALDSLAAEGIRFDDAVTSAPVTLPSHATIFTGLDPPNHGVRNNGEFPLDSRHVTLAEVLGDQGYDTAAFISAFVLDARFGLDQGFQFYDDNVGVAAASVTTQFSKPIYERSATDVTSASVRWLRQRDRTDPFFCWVHYFDPHKPYRAPATFARRFRGRAYDGEIAYMDSQVQRLLSTIERIGAKENTLVIAVGDHGEGLGDHGEATHAKLIYDSVMRVPLIMSCPSLFRGPQIVDDVVVSVADIFPTVLDLLGVEMPGPVDGRSLLSARSATGRIVYLENLASYLDNGWSPLYGLRRHHDKYIRAPRSEYYDLRSDPGELNNLFATGTTNQAEARNMLVKELAARLVGQPSLAAVTASALPIDPEALDRLAALGYIRSASPGATSPDELPDPKDMMPVLRALDRADGLCNAGRFEQALGVLKGAAALSPRDPRLLLTLGKTYLHMGKRVEAEQALQARLSVHETSDVCILIAQIMLASSRLDESEKMLSRAEELDPKHGGIFLARGDLLALRRRPQEAIAMYAHAAKLDPYRVSAEAEARINRLEEIVRIAPP